MMAAQHLREPGSPNAECRRTLTGQPCQDFGLRCGPIHRVVELLTELLATSSFIQPPPDDPANVIIIMPGRVRLHTRDAFQIARWLNKANSKRSSDIARKLMNAAKLRDLGQAFEPGRDYLA